MSFFSAVTPRTAGFNTVDLTSLLPSTWFLTLLLMWIGASPLSTGGGVKIILLSILWIGTATCLVAFWVPEGSVTQILFEVTSAISTVGLSLDFTSQLNTAGKIIISLTMFVGRVGLITLLSGLIPRQSSQSYTYAEENVIV